MRETSQPVVDKVAIIGAGPGGLATAIALRKKTDRLYQIRLIGHKKISNCHNLSLCDSLSS
ncbi:MAG: hypothetical protein F6K54_23820 [Okeania sp. SIO3B5]|uniref:hypothetical protein n=1 Tax=Okeania sp. SIO3B5 TaxID=2607811 RepID=UPI0013FE5652|nr:hypothetical protein [Okeania sp. SIO3B5]NEO55829.1 hypothetical protein [Okeania sp. SIO3B5]